MATDTEQPKNSGPCKTKTPARKLLGVLLANLSVALAAKVESERIVMYINALDDLSELQIKHAFKRAVKFWQPSYGRTFPSPAELREYAEEIDGALQATSEVDPEKLPKDWSERDWKRGKLTLDSARTLTSDLNDNPDESRADHAKRLIAEMRTKIKSGANAFPSDRSAAYGEHATHLARERLGPSQVPTDPMERRKWAREKAETQGWIGGFWKDEV